MRENKRVRVLKNIAGCLLLVSVLHHMLDEPTRLPLIRTVVAQLKQRMLLRHDQPDPQPPISLQPKRLWLEDASFEQWNMESYPTLRVWSTVVTVAAWDVVKKETDTVQHGEAAVRLECDGSSHCGNVCQELSSSRFRGHWLQFSIWALSTTPGTPCVHIDDGINRSSTCLQNHGGTWQPVTVERMISPEATRVLLMIERTREAENTVPVYVDNASLTEDPPLSEAPSTIAVTAPQPPPSSEQP